MMEMFTEVKCAIARESLLAVRVKSRLHTLYVLSQIFSTIASRIKLEERAR